MLRKGIPFQVPSDRSVAGSCFIERRPRALPSATQGHTTHAFGPVRVTLFDVKRPECTGAVIKQRLAASGLLGSGLSQGNTGDIALGCATLRP